VLLWFSDTVYSLTNYKLWVRVLLRDIQAGRQDTKAFQEAIFISIPAVAQRTHPKAEPLIYILGRLQKHETEFILLYTILLATSSSVPYNPFHVQLL
jgi:hypothetical protein